MIQVQSLTKRYGDFTALDNVSFTVKKGETFALLGPNGSGKSTTLKCIVGLIIPESGKIQIGSFKAQDRKAKALMSYMPQRISFPECLTAREVMEFYSHLRKISSRRINQLFDESSFHFNGFADRTVSEFSGGMIQRLGLAVTCLPDSPILVLDEPTISLDPEGAIHFRNFLKELKASGKTILFSSHMLADVEQLADKVAIMVAGKIVAMESINSLRDSISNSNKILISIQNPQAKWIEIACHAGASNATLSGNILALNSKSEERYSILRELERAGAVIESLTTQDLSLEDIYMRYLHERQT
jgi:Cu-processing system ATP-binding protein